MITRRTALASGLSAFGAAALGSPLPAVAAEETAKAFLDRIYKAYIGKDAHGMPLDQSTVIRLFTPSLRKLIAADAAESKRRDEPGNLDGDPFVDAQEWDIHSVAINVEEPTPGKAKANVRFKNFDKDVTISLDLMRTSGAWRIDEIVGPSGSLRALLTKH